MSANDQPSVSICLLTYNQESVIAQSLGSILAQTYPRLEILVLDDASSDATGDIVKALADKRVRYIRNPTNLGEYFSLNKGISLTTGEFVAIYHGDDVYKPMIVEEEVAYLRTHPASAAVFCLNDFITEAGKVSGGANLPQAFRNCEYLEYDQVFRVFLRHNNILLRTPTAMIRRDVLRAVGPFDAAKYGGRSDGDMWIRILQRHPIGVLNKRLMYYRVGSARTSARYRRLRTTREMFLDVMDRYIEADGWREKATRQEMTEYAFHVCDDETFRAANFVIRGDPRAALELLRRPYPWRTFLNGITRRKLRVALLLALMRIALRSGNARALRQLLVWTEYGGRL